MASSSSSQSAEGRSSLLTFGIEMEFVVAYMPEGKADPHPEDGRKIYIGGKPPGYVPIPTEGMVQARYNYMLEHEMEFVTPKAKEMNPNAIQAQANDMRIRANRLDRKPYGEPEDPEAYAHIRYRMARFLRDHSIPAISDSNDKTTEDLVEKTPEEAWDKLHFGNGDEDPVGIDYGCWDVNTDISVSGTHTNEYLWAPIEITSPVLYYSPESLELVRYIVNLLQSEFRILIDSTMMFHVHVGRGAKGFSFTELQAITALLYAAAPRLDQLHPIWCGPLTLWAPGARPHSLMANLDKEGMAKAKRRGETASPMNPLLTTETDIDDRKARPASRMLEPYLRPMRSIPAHEMLQQWLGHQRAHAFAAARIWETQTLKELYDCLSTVYLSSKKESYHFRPAYNFRNLIGDPLVKKTIEFRQHCGTMSPDAIVNWISVAAGLCNFCVNSPLHEGLNPVMRKLEHIDPNSATSWEMNCLPGRLAVNTTSLLYGRPGAPYSVYDLLRDVGLAPQAEYYQQRGLHSLPPDFFPIRDRNKDISYGLPPAEDPKPDNKSSTDPGGRRDKPKPETAGH